MTPRVSTNGGRKQKEFEPKALIPFEVALFEEIVPPYQAVAEKAAILKKQGMTIHKIATKLKVSAGTVKRALK